MIYPEDFLKNCASTYSQYLKANELDYKSMPFEIYLLFQWSEVVGGLRIKFTEFIIENYGFWIEHTFWKRK